MPGGSAVSTWWSYLSERYDCLIRESTQKLLYIWPVTVKHRVYTPCPYLLRFRWVIGNIPLSGPLDGGACEDGVFELCPDGSGRRC